MSLVYSAGGGPYDSRVGNPLASSSGSLLLELSGTVPALEPATEPLDPGFTIALDVGLPAELENEFAEELVGKSPTLLELVAELSGTSAELKAELELLKFSPTEELLCSSQTTLDEEAATGGVSGDGESSEQALNIAQTPAANKELNKTFFIINLLIPRLKLDLII